MAMTYRPSEQLNEQLIRQAETEHISVQRLLDKAVEAYLARTDKTRRLDEAMDIILVNSAEALRRLGEGPGADEDR